MRRALVALLLFTAGGARAAEGELVGRAEAGPGWDSNALRETEAGQVVGDGFLGAIATLRGELAGDRTAGTAQLTEGGKLFLRERAANLAASRLYATGRFDLSRAATLAAEVDLKDLTERGHVRDYDAGRGLAALDLRFRGAALRLAAGYGLVAPRTGLPRTFAARGPDGLATLSLPLGADHALTAGYDLWWKVYWRWPHTDDDPDGRTDAAHTVFAAWSWRGPLLVALGYGFTVNASSALGAGYDRHRVTARLAAFLPGGFALAAQGALQRSSYPTGYALAPEQLLADNDENQNSLEVKLTRPLGRGLEAALKLAFYGNELSGTQGADATFARSVVSASVAWRGGE